MMRTGLKPDDRCMASMVAAYEKKNLLDKALDLLLKLEKEGLEAGVATNTILLDWMGRLPLVEEAESFLRKIKERGEPPLEVHVSLCEMYSKAGNEEKARQSLIIVERNKDLLKGNQFEQIASGLAAGRLLNDAKRFVDAMQERGFAPSESLKVALVAAQSIPRHQPPLKKKAATHKGGR